MYILFFAVIITFLLYCLLRKPETPPEGPTVPMDTEDQMRPQRYDIRSFLAFSSIFWGIGLIMVIGGCIKLYNYKIVTQTYRLTTAQITDIRKYEVLDNDGNFDDKTDIYLSYTANDQNYQAIIKDANIYHSIGSEIDIYYSPNDPEDIVSPENVENKLSFIIPMGVILCIIPFVLEFFGRILLKKKKASAD